MLEFLAILVPVLVALFGGLFAYIRVESNRIMEYNKAVYAPIEKVVRIDEKLSNIENKMNDVWEAVTGKHGSK